MFSLKVSRFLVMAFLDLSALIHFAGYKANLSSRARALGHSDHDLAMSPSPLICA